MERSVALKKLGKRIGKDFGYRINPKAASPEERERAKAMQPSANELRDSLHSQVEARRMHLLKEDAEYQRLHAAWKDARKYSENLSATLHGRKITVGKTMSIGGIGMFNVMAEGDTWEEIFAKLEPV